MTDACGVPAVRAATKGSAAPGACRRLFVSLACYGNANFVSGPRATCIRLLGYSCATMRGDCPAGSPTRVPCADAALRKTRSLNYPKPSST